MDHGFLCVSMLLAYGPFALMLCLYAAALVLKFAGKPELLTVLIARTGPQEPVKRGHGEGSH
jgi:hypothetical protein